MPMRPANPCLHPRCPLMAAPGSAWCATHRRTVTVEARKLDDERRGSAAARGYDSKWTVQARIFRQKFPLCTCILIPLPDWTLELAQEFHALRAAAAERGEYLKFIGMEAGEWLEKHPIYRIHRLAMAEPSEAVDHIVPHKGDQKLFWDQANWQALSLRAHNMKTAKHDGGFRNAEARS